MSKSNLSKLHEACEQVLDEIVREFPHLIEDYENMNPNAVMEPEEAAQCFFRLKELLNRRDIILEAYHYMDWGK